MDGLSQHPDSCALGSYRRIMKTDKIAEDSLHLAKGMSDAELQNRVDSLKNQIESYKITMVNYPPERMNKHGLPRLQYLQEKLATFVDELKSRQP